MARYQLILAYDGTDFSGFQRQGNTRTVQQVVEKALMELGLAGGINPFCRPNRLRCSC